MVPNSLIMVLLVLAFFPATFSYLFGWPKRRLVNPYFAVLAGSAALMLFVVILAIFDLHIVWLSWVLLACAILSVARSIIMLRRGLAVVREHERASAEHRARGH
jgi:hypothetical protein